MMNISEFERTKPTETYKAIQSLISKYSSRANTEVMEDRDEIERAMSREIKDDLLRLRKVFIEGK